MGVRVRNDRKFDFIMSQRTGQKYVDSAVLQKILRLDLRARIVVEGFVNGQHQSPYHGLAVEFATHREYVPGDEIKHLDWKVWSKTDRLYVKEYEEETNLRCLLVLDASRSMLYGQRSGWSKFDHGATVAASLARLVALQQDAVGLAIFDRTLRTHLPPSAHAAHRRALMHELESARPDECAETAAPFQQLAERLRHRGIVCLISDLFVDLASLDGALAQLQHAGHEAIVCHVMHSDELTFPFRDHAQFQGLEQPRQLRTDPRSLRTAYLEAVDRFLHRVRRMCALRRADYVLLDTGKPLDAALAQYLAARQNRLRGARR